MSSKTRSALKALGLLIAGGALGAGLSVVFHIEPAGDDRPGGPARTGLQGEVGRLRGELLAAQHRIKDLEEQLATDWSRPSTNIRAATAIPVDDATTAPPDSSTLANLRGRIAELEGALQRVKAGDSVLDDAAMADKIRSVQDAFRTAVANRDGAKALALMKELSALDERAFPAVVELWSEMKKNKWLGLGWRERNRWADKDVLHWALRTDQLAAMDPKEREEFQRSAVWMLRWYEDDPQKQAESYLAFLKGLPVPTEELKRDEEGGRGRGRDDMDVYRSTLRNLSRIPSADAARLLSDLALNPSAPADVRLLAVRGLGDQEEALSSSAMQAALSDPDPQVRQAADIELKRRNPPAAGWLITSVSNASQAAGAGLQPGAIILEYNGKPVTRTEELVRAIRGSKGSVDLTVLQGGKRLTVSVNGGERLGVNGDGVAPKR